MKTLLEQLQQLAPLAAAATEGPWAYQPEYDDALVFFDQDGTGVCPNPYRPICRMDDLEDDWAESNAIFIAAARNVLTPDNLTLLVAALAGPGNEPAQNPLVAFLLSSDTGVSSKSIAARYAGVLPAHGYYGHPYDSSDFGRCHRLLQLVPDINIAIMRGASPVWEKLVAAWPMLTMAYEQGPDWQAFQAIINPLTRS